MTATNIVLIFVTGAITRMNYIKELEGKVREANKAASEAKEALHMLQAYLASPKFYNDPYVNKADVFARLEPVASAVMDAIEATKERV